MPLKKWRKRKLNSDVTGKRDYQKLKNDKLDYYAPCNEMYLYRISFENNSVIKNKTLKENL